MSDDLDDLKKMFDTGTPAPDATRRKENIALAQKNFADHQGSANQVRPTLNGPLKGLWIGAQTMMNTLTSRAGLTACTALVAVGLVAFTPIGNGLKAPWNPAQDQQLGKQEHEFFENEMSRRAEGDINIAAAPMTEPLMVEEMASSDLVDLAATSRVTAQPQSAIRQSVPRKQIVNDAPQTIIHPNTETFANAPTNPVHVTTETPVSTFSIDVDTASYSVIRNYLTNGQLPPPEAVRVEEMVNYFTYDYAAPTNGDPFQPTVSVTSTPWNPDTQLVAIGLQGELPDITDRPPLNLVFLIDTSGSMNQANKLPLLKQSFRLMLGQLRPTDEVSIVTYAGSAGRVLDPTPAGERSTILAALDQLGAGGSTAGQAGLQQAYATAAQMRKDGEVSRVILATDGDFNVGINDPEALKTYIADKRDTGTYLSVLGFGRGNLDDATMQALAQNGNGQAAYIDTLSEAQKVLVDQLTGALFPIANDVKIQVEFNPAAVSEYRLIGYETRALRREDFNNDKVDAGDIGAGHNVTALYEVTPTGAPTQNDPLRYADTAPAGDSDELGFLRLRYKAPGAVTSQLIETPIANQTTGEAGFATAIAGFGQLLRGTTYLRDWSYDDAIALATKTKGDDPFGYRSEAIQLMRLASSLSQN